VVHRGEEVTRKKLEQIAISTVAFLVVIVGILTDSMFVAWVGWGVLFAGLEIRALIDQSKGDTLSEQVWLGTLSKNRFWAVFWKVFVACLLTWLFFHLLLGA
jgi:hypothetical protein